MRWTRLRRRRLIPYITAGAHLAAFWVTVLYVYRSADGEAALVWIWWSLPDFPVSLFPSGRPYSMLIHSIVPDNSPLSYVVYWPHLVHGVLGTMWWFCMPRWLLRHGDRRADHAQS